MMAPEREFLLEQATACRQLALISNAQAAAKLHELATEYEAKVLIDASPVLTTLGKRRSAALR